MSPARGTGRSVLNSEPCTNAEHMREDLAVYEFELPEEDIETLVRISG